MIEQLRHFIRTYEESLSAGDCEQLVQTYKSMARYAQPNGRDIRAGLEDSAWTELNLDRVAGQPLLAEFRAHVARAFERYNADVGLKIPLPLTHHLSPLVMKRYRPSSGEQFQLHFDAIHHVADRYLVLLWYLNDVTSGGETRFPQLGVSVEARRGRLLMFPPYWMYQHEGAAPLSGDKYIVSTYLLFKPPQS